MELTAQKREIFGKKVKALRTQGLIPAELYGNKKENYHLSVPEKEFAAVFKQAGESTIVTVNFEKEKIPSLIHDVELDPISQKISHIDFYAVKMDEKIKVEIPLEFIGESSAVKQGGVLVKSMKEIEVEALPTDLPHSFGIDLSKLENIHDSIRVSDLKIDSKVKILVESETVIATVIEPAKEEEVAPAVSVEDVKVEGEEKKKEREAVKEEEAK